MKFAKWLYNLSGTDHLIIMAFFAIGLGLSYFTIIVLRAWHEKLHGSIKYTHAVRITPFGLVGIALAYMVILYMSMGEMITRWVAKLSQ
ncbi:MAG: hypothetical protein QF842_06175 [Candidatus Marinimicrobia bacterium]|nr:hypothetical protein [Candidatus Neomarinimicrobiota bacterium]MDP6611517.1 hypothetical protein [Candidatus Neomarinimicrobiota bacterium]